MASYILLSSIILLICLFLHSLSGHLGIPMLLAFILLGMLFGSDGLFKIHFDNYALAEQVCSFALIFIMFYGGFGTNWNTAKPIAVKSVLLSTLGVLLTALLTGLFCHFILRMNLLESLLIGSVISSTDAASVFSILRSKRLNLRDHTAPMLEVESGSNDPFSYMLTLAVLSVMEGSAHPGIVLGMLLRQVIFGLLIGIATALLATYVLGKMKHEKDGVDTIFIFTMALFSYAAATFIGGNGFLSVYLTGILLGNRNFPNKIALIHFFDGITGLMQIAIFFLLGLLSFPSHLPSILLPALAIALFLTFVARPAAVFAILTPFRCSHKQKLLVSWGGLRGAASIVFAIMATAHPSYTKYDLYHIVFFIVLFSIAIQGSLIPLVAKKLDMIDDNANIMKTFNDYSEEIPVQFIKLSIPPGHPWVGKQIKHLDLIPDLLLVLILRGEARVIPKGSSQIQANDVIVLSALSLNDKVEGSLSEVILGQDSEWLGKTLAQFKPEEEKLIVAIKRNKDVLIPNGQTILCEQDILIISQL